MVGKQKGSRSKTSSAAETKETSKREKSPHHAPLHAVLTQCWSCRQSAEAWGLACREVLFDSGTADQAVLDERARELCNLLFKQASVGPFPSTLLLDYVRYCLGTKLVPPRVLVETLVDDCDSQRRGHSGAQLSC